MADLARPGDPYITPRGEMVVKNEKDLDTITRVENFAPVLRKMTINNRRSIADLPCTDVGEQTAINAIMIYQLLGLTPIEIGGALKLPVAVIQDIQHGSDYQNTFEEVFNELINTHSHSIKAKVAAFATTAVDNMITLASKAKNENARVKANQDLLDRAGFSSEVMHGGNHSDEGDALKIVIEDSGGTSTRVEVDLSKVRKR
jgi:hypothetical protein